MGKHSRKPKNPLNLVSLYDDFFKDFVVMPRYRANFNREYSTWISLQLLANSEISKSMANSFLSYSSFFYGEETQTASLFALQVMPRLSPGVTKLLHNQHCRVVTPELEGEISQQSWVFSAKYCKANNG